MEIKPSALVLGVLILCKPLCEVTSLWFIVTMDTVCQTNEHTQGYTLTQVHDVCPYWCVKSVSNQAVQPVLQK